MATAAVALAFCLFEFGARRLYGYAITPAYFEVRFFGRFPVYRIALRDIEDAVPWQASPGELAAAFTTLRLGNRIFGSPVVIVLHGGFLRRVIVTPDDSRRFIAELRANVAAISLRRPARTTSAPE